MGAVPALHPALQPPAEAGEVAQAVKHLSSKQQRLVPRKVSPSARLVLQVPPPPPTAQQAAMAARAEPARSAPTFAALGAGEVLEDKSLEQAVAVAVAVRCKPDPIPPAGPVGRQETAEAAAVQVQPRVARAAWVARAGVGAGSCPA